jgi:phosphatidylglycerol:prolipoprotein diacylglycerol transferase
LPFPDFDPVLLQLGPIAIRWYALAYVAGILLGWRWGVHLIKRASLWRGAAPTANERQIDDLVLWITLGIIVGGRLGYIAFYRPDLIVSDPMEIVRTWNGGMSFHGGLIGVSLAILGFAISNKIDIVRLADVTAPCVPIGLFFGRLANFINGELWGRPTDLPWGVIFPRAGIEPRHPSQLYEAALEGVGLFLILLWATHIAKLLPRKGAVCGLFLTGYGLFRVALESVRAPDIGMPAFPFGLTMGTMLSIPMIVIGLVLIANAMRPASLAPPAPEGVDEPDSAA